MRLAASLILATLPTSSPSDADPLAPMLQSSPPPHIETVPADLLNLGTTPEPSSMALVMASATILMRRQRRRR